MPIILPPTAAVQGSIEFSRHGAPFEAGGTTALVSRRPLDPSAADTAIVTLIGNSRVGDDNPRAVVPLDEGIGDLLLVGGDELAGSELLDQLAAELIRSY
jgi:hypothetical protein